MSTFTFGGVGEHTLSLSVSLSDWEGSTVVSAHKDPLINKRARLIARIHATKRGSNMEREGTKDHKTKPNRVPVSVNSAYIDSAAQSRCVETDFPVSCALFLSLQCLAWVFLGDDLATSLPLSLFRFCPSSENFSQAWPSGWGNPQCARISV